MPELRHEDTVFILDIGDDENRFSPDRVKQVHALLDELEAHPGPAALVTTGTGKFFSNGLDLDWIGAHPNELMSYVADVQELFARILTLPVPTIAAINGHAFGAGAMLAIAHDFRIMRSDRGYFCFPEVDINIPFTPGMAALIQGKLTPAAAIASMTTGRRFAAPKAHALGLIDATAPEADLLTAASDQVRPLAGKDRKTLASIKSTMFSPALTALRASTPM